MFGHYYKGYSCFGLTYRPFLFYSPSPFLFHFPFLLLFFIFTLGSKLPCPFPFSLLCSFPISSPTPATSVYSYNFLSFSHVSLSPFPSYTPLLPPFPVFPFILFFPLPPFPSLLSLTSPLKFSLSILLSCSLLFSLFSFSPSIFLFVFYFSSPFFPLAFSLSLLFSFLSFFLSLFLFILYFYFDLSTFLSFLSIFCFVSLSLSLFLLYLYHFLSFFSIVIIFSLSLYLSHILSLSLLHLSFIFHFTFPSSPFLSPSQNSVQMKYYLERLFSSYADVPEVDEDDDEDEKPTLAVRPRMRQIAPALPQHRRPTNPWLAGRLPDEELVHFFARRTAESAWESSQHFFEHWHVKMCQVVGPANVTPYWRKVMDFAKKLEDDTASDRFFYD